MHGIWIAAAVTSGLMVAVVGGILWAKAPREHRPWLALAMILQLPMSAATYYAVRVPLMGVIDPFLTGDATLRWLRFLYAPLTEEPAKLWPLLLPMIARRVKRETLVWYGVALGLGFAMGEAWFIADLIAGTGRFADVPWWQFNGFINERFIVVATHSAMVATSLRGWRCWRGGLPAGLAVAMGMHLFGNLPIGVVPLLTGPEWAPVVLSLVIAVTAVGAIVLLVYYHTGSLRPSAVLGRATCPKCGVTYERPFLALNLGPKRYERCPSCKRWSLV